MKCQVHIDGLHPKVVQGIPQDFLQVTKWRSGVGNLSSVLLPLLTWQPPPPPRSFSKADAFRETITGLMIRLLLLLFFSLCPRPLKGYLPCHISFSFIGQQLPWPQWHKQKERCLWEESFQVWFLIRDRRRRKKALLYCLVFENQKLIIDSLIFYCIPFLTKAISLPNMYVHVNTISQGIQWLHISIWPEILQTTLHPWYNCPHFTAKEAETSVNFPKVTQLVKWQN